MVWLVDGAGCCWIGYEDRKLFLWLRRPGLFEARDSDAMGARGSYLSDAGKGAEWQGCVWCRHAQMHKCTYAFGFMNLALSPHRCRFIHVPEIYVRNHPSLRRVQDYQQPACLPLQSTRRLSSEP